MAERYGALTLQIKQLSNLANVGSTYTDIFDASGDQVINGIGDGSFAFSARSATLYAAVISNIGQVAYLYVTDEVAGGAAMDVATFIMEEVSTSTTDQGAMVTVSGASIEEQLTYNGASDDAIDDGAGGESSSDLDDIMGYAASGWSYSATGTGSATRSSTGSYHSSRGDNVMELLIATAKRSGDVFRLSTYSPPTKIIDWRATADSSGVTLRMPTSPINYDGSTTTGIIYSLTEEVNVKERITGIRPYGAGLGGGRIDITNINAGDTGGDPAGFTTTFASNLIVNDTLETALGYEKRVDLDLSAWQADEVDNATQLTTAAVQIWNAAINTLQERDSSKKFYRVVCNVAADLRPGQTVVVDYDEYEGGTSGGTNVININDTLTIHEVSNTISDGVRITSLLVADTVHKRTTPAGAIANAVNTARKTTRKADALTTPGAVSADIQIVAGNGLTGGGDLSANRTLNVGAGDGIDVGADSVGVDVTDIIGNGLTESSNDIVLGTPGAITSTSTDTVTTSSHTHSADSTIAKSTDLHDAVTAGDGINLSGQQVSVDVTDILGNGLTESSNDIVLGTPSVLTVATSNGVTTTSHTHAITTSSDPGSAASILASDSSGYLTLEQLTIGTATNAQLFLDGAAGASRDVRFRSGSTSSDLRWVLRANNAAESGSDAGSNLQILARDDSGAAVVTALQITRSTGYANFGQFVKADGIGVNTTATLDDTIIFNDGSSNIYLSAVDPVYPDDGLSVRIASNPTAGEPIFRVMSSGGAERLRVEHDGDLSTTNNIAAPSMNINSGDVIIDSGGIDMESVGDQGVRFLTTNTDLSGSSVFYDLNEADRDAGVLGGFEMGFYKNATNTTQIRMSKQIFDVVIMASGTWYYPLEVRWNQVLMQELPTSDPSIVGALWRDGADVKIST